MTTTPSRRINSKMSSAQAANFAKSLPIEIANSPLTVGRSYMATLESDDDVSVILSYNINNNINSPFIFVLRNLTIMLI